MYAINIKTGEVLEGGLPNKALKLVSEWIELHRDELMKIWETQEFKKLKSVKPLSDMILNVEFINGDIKYYDVKPLLNKWEVFKDLKENNLFNLVSVDTGGYGINPPNKSCVK